MFNKLGHRVLDNPLRVVLDGKYARDMGLDGHTVYFAICGAACWEPTEEALDLPRCQTCWKAPRRPRVSA